MTSDLIEKMAAAIRDARALPGSKPAPRISDVDRRAATAALSVISALRPIETAPRDGTYILATLATIKDQRWRHLSGRRFVIRHEGYTQSGYDMGWWLFPGLGGAADWWIEGWMHLPASPR
ncbi:hypothetical protein GCM10007897_41310 [Sphingobium jiangsuense]|uniref:Uncharacterized protein n=1 Tax=Sphingobium jiangsuense TaxID=870476 RepID=A0A7W6FR52_9SPHN|nr:hypothetical protein [Sphingobium jiangsuense]MBB3927806.1 hypothetical protein [Sphingobium jiangsuense]GLT02709.1 hypothetical protein GCM10007897_41310 [Sphingobium jiangsuense]